MVSDRKKEKTCLPNVTRRRGGGEKQQGSCPPPPSFLRRLTDQSGGGGGGPIQGGAREKKIGSSRKLHGFSKRNVIENKKWAVFLPPCPTVRLYSPLEAGAEGTVEETRNWKARAKRWRETEQERKKLSKTLELRSVLFRGKEGCLLSTYASIFVFLHLLFSEITAQ